MTKVHTGLTQAPLPQRGLSDVDGAGGSGPPFTPPVAPPVTGEFGIWMSREVSFGGPQPPDESPIGGWDDRSGNGNDLFGGSPTFVVSDGPGIVFGDSDSFQTTAGFSTTNGLFLNWVGSIDDPNTAGSLFCFGTGFGVGGWEGLNVSLDGSGNIVAVDNLGASLILGPAGNGLHDYMLSYDNSTLRFWIDGLIQSTHIQAMSLLTNSPVAIGSGNSFSGPTAFMTLFEVVVYPFAFNVSQLNQNGEWYTGIGVGAPTIGAPWTDISPAATGLNLWTEANFVTPQTDGTTIATMPDHSGLGNNFTVPLTNTGFLLKLGIDGLNSVLRGTGIAAKGMQCPPLSAQPLTIILRVKPINSQMYLFDGITSGNRAAAGYTILSDSKINIFAGSGFGATYSIGFNVWTFIFNGASSSIKFNGTQIAFGSVGSGDASAGLFLGRDWSGTAPTLNGDITAMLSYANIAPASIQAGENYLMSL